MRLTLTVFLLGLPCVADAAEVVWIGRADDALIAQVAAEAGATGNALTPLQFRSAAARWSEDDAKAYAKLDDALQSVRPYESKLDGELVIMEDLARPIAAITVMRNEHDRNKLFATLAYQGFAVDRYYGDKLATDERAAPFRTDLNGVAVELPWMDAVALEPERQITPYEIAEAPQRADYAEIQREVAAALPASIVPTEVPPGSTIYVDGRPVDPGATGTLRVVPGRHFVHVQQGELIVARHSARLGPGQRFELTMPVTDGAWRAFVDMLHAGNGAIPSGIKDAIASLGGEVWVAEPSGKTARVYKVTPAGFEEVKLGKSGGGGGGGDSEGGLSLAAGVGGGWFNSGDFYAQDPWTVPHESASVNAGAAGLALEVAYDVGLVRFGAGVDTLFTLGEHHVALTGGSGMRLRPYPHVMGGIQYAQATVGFLFPYHLGGGLQGTVPIAAGVEARASATFGLPLNGSRDDGSEWAGHPVSTVWLGVGYRLGL